MKGGQDGGAKTPSNRGRHFQVVVWNPRARRDQPKPSRQHYDLHVIVGVVTEEAAENPKGGSIVALDRGKRTFVATLALRAGEDQQPFHVAIVFAQARLESLMIRKPRLLFGRRGELRVLPQRLDGLFDLLGLNFEFLNLLLFPLNTRLEPFKGRLETFLRCTRLPSCHVFLL
jgi:hypothetical protein